MRRCAQPRRRPLFGSRVHCAVRAACFCVVASVAGFGVACHGRSSPSMDPIVARVAGRPVVQSEVKAAYAARRLGLRAETVPAAAAAALWQASLDDVIAWHVVDGAARAQHVTVLEDEMDGEMQRLALGASDGGDAGEGGEKGDESGAPEEGSERTDAGAHGPRSLPIERAKSEEASPPAGGELVVAIEPTTVPDEMLGTQRMRLRDAVGQRLLVAKYFAQEVAARVAIRDADIEAYAAAHPEALQRKARVRLRFVVLPGAQALAPLKKALQQGKPFERALQPEPAAVMHDVGWVALDALPSELSSRVASLPVQRLSEPWPMGEGVAVAWVSERQAASVEPLATAWRRVERRLRNERERAAEAEVLRLLTQAAHVEVIDAALPKTL